MKYLKKISLFVMIFATMFLVTGCGKEEDKKDENKIDNKTENKEETNDEKVDGKLEDLMTKIYEDIPEDERPMMLMNTEVNDENVEYFLGTTDIEYEEALGSESAVGSIAHSVVLVRAKEGADINAVKKTIKENAKPRKWVCVEAEEVIVDSRGDLIILIMSSSSNAKKLQDGFKSL